MMKLLRFLSDNILFVITLFLLAFIPLYPKLPLIDIQHTWVKVRIEDFLVGAALVFWGVQILRKKATFKSPLTIPIIVFWVVGAISTVYAIFIIFPHIANVFPSITWLHYLRRIEYLSLFFVAFSSIRSKKFIPWVAVILSITLLLVIIYGFGQKSFSYTFDLGSQHVTLGWPQTFYAYSTMNEEFAKGIPLLLSPLGRIQSTFGGHYDLAAYLVLVIPIMGSMVIGFKNKFSKVYFFITAVLGLVLLLLTASRVSFAVYLITISFMLILQRKKLFIIPVVILSILLLQSFQGISLRFGSTISQVDLVVDARTGKAVGIAKKGNQDSKKPILIEETQSTGENLPQGTGYINLPAEQGTKTITEVLYKRTQLRAGSESAEITNIEGDFVIKKALAYDVSFTTRFQGEWPRAIEAFKRNVLLGSGYSSISLATDNDYLRMLGETGIAGTAAFVILFIIYGIYVYKVAGEITSSSARSMVLGITAGIFGLSLNAILIDVFEASKVAFVLWMLIGISVGILYLYQKQKINFVKELRNVLLSSPAILVYLLFASIGIFSIMLQNYFVADDFTWLRWVADCKKVLYTTGATKCEPFKTTITNYFTDSQGFFYRPGTKVYFYGMYSLFWLNSFAYHVVSLLFHYLTTALVFLISYRILQKKVFAFIAAFFFLILSGHSEAVFWISSTGHLISSALVLIALLAYIYWRDGKSILFFIASIIACVLAPLFHELGIIAPILIIVYDLTTEHSDLLKQVKKRWFYIVYLFPIPLYLFMRRMAKSLGPQGDYNYSIPHLPFNVVGNLVGYVGLTLIGSRWLEYYRQMRDYGKGHVGIAAVGLLIGIVGIVLVFRFAMPYITKTDKKIFLISLTLFVIPLMPFLGLGNITLRYVYLASFGVVLFMGLLLEKLHLVIRPSNKYLAMIFVILCVTTFSYFHIQELQRVNEDWQQAGKLSNNLLVSFNDAFPKHNATPQNPVFYFVNVPIRLGEAWVFPVGLPDALWFTFQNSNLSVNISKSLDLALDSAEGSQSARVFEFDKEGSVSEVIRTKTTKEVPIEKK